MKLTNNDLQVIMKGLEELEKKGAPPWCVMAVPVREKISEFMLTSGTTCPTAVLSCPFTLGSRTSERKRASSRENGKKGGRPKKIDS